MLDMFWLLDTEDMPEDDTPGNDRYIGSLALDQAEALRCVWELCKKQGIEFNYAYDSRWLSHEVKSILDCCDRCSKQTTNVVHKYTIGVFVDILNKAIAQGSGIAACAD